MSWFNSSIVKVHTHPPARLPAVFAVVVAVTVRVSDCHGDVFFSRRCIHL